MNKSIDRRGPVIVVEQWSHREGPSFWQPCEYATGSAAQRREWGLRTIARLTGKLTPEPHCTRSVFVQERGRWVPA